MNNRLLKTIVWFSVVVIVLAIIAIVTFVTLTSAVEEEVEKKRPDTTKTFQGKIGEIQMDTVEVKKYTWNSYSPLLGEKKIVYEKK